MTEAIDRLRQQITRLMERSRFAEASPLLDEYLERNTNDPWSWVNLALLSARMGDAGRAKSTARETLSRWPALGVAEQSTLANVLFRTGDIEGAAALFRECAKMTDFSQPQILFNLAAACRSLGRLEEAESLYDQVIRTRPGDAEAIKNRSELRRQTEDDNHLEEISETLAKTRPAEHRMRLLFALGKEHEDLGHHALAFEAYSEGNALKRKTINYNLGQDLNIMESLAQIEFRYADRLQTGPIFVAGLPRSGTTVVNRILSCHSQVISIGESVAFPAAMQRAAVSAGIVGTGQVQDRVFAYQNLNSTQLRNAYLEEASRRHAILPEALSRVVDKLPLNYLHIGLIRHAFPDASIVLLERNPMDLVVALYRTLFLAPYPFAYDLRELCSYLIGYTRLARHWVETIPGLYRISYESLVTAQEAETRRLLGGCNLSWESACLAPHQLTTPETTASAAQVRSPIHAGSVGQWRHYERQLESARDLFDAAGIEYATS